MSNTNIASWLASIVGLKQDYKTNWTETTKADWKVTWKNSGSADSAPVNAALPTIAGTATHALTLTLTPGTYTGFPAPVLTHQWVNSVSGPIPGATGLTYVVQVSDEGATLNVVETAVNTDGTVVVSSAPTAVVN